MVLTWLAEHWFDALETAGIVSGFFFTSITIRKDEKARRLQSLFILTRNHREIWSEIYRRPELKRILDSKADLTAKAVTDEERLFVNFLVFHLNDSYRAIENGLYARPEGLNDDIRGFFSLPIPRMVWEHTKNLQDREFVLFVERALSTLHS